MNLLYEYILLYFCKIRSEIKGTALMKKVFKIIVALLICSDSVSLALPEMTNLNVEDGLSNNYVKDIAQDGQGFIWIATETGLNRFDGRNFTTYTSSNSELLNDAINTLLFDPADNLLWIGTKTCLSVLNCSSLEFKHYHGNDSIVLSNIVHLSPATDGGIWIANHHHGLVHYNKKNKQFTSYNGKNTQGLKNANWCTLDDGKGFLYVGHAQQGLSIVNLEDKTVRHFQHEPDNPRSLPGNSVYTIYIDHMENIWLGTNQGLALFNPRKEEFHVFKHEPDNPNSLIADHIYDIKEMDNGTLWIASDIGGVSILDLYEISFVNEGTVNFTNITPTSESNDLSSGNIRTLLQDKFGNIWIGNYSSGVDFVSHTPPLFQTLLYTLIKANKMRNKPVWGIYADEKQQVWIGGENEIAVFEDNRLKDIIDISAYQNRPYAQVFSMQGNQQGILLLGLYDDGLLELNTQTKKIRRIDLGMDDIDIITFCEAPDGKIWIGAEYGIYIYENGKAEKEEKITNQLSDRSVYGIVHDRQGKIWVGTYGGGISIFDKDFNLVRRLTINEEFFSNAINYLFQDSQGGIWIATRDGIGYIQDTSRPELFEQYSQEHGLTDLFVRSIQEDHSGNIWISTNLGISLWDNRKKVFNNYTHHDGIPAGNFIEGSSCLAADGTVYFGSLNGVCYFNPKEVMAVRQIAPVQIVECKVFNRQQEKENGEFLAWITNGKIELKYHQNSFRISFSVPDYAQSQQAEYAYMIDGLDNAWISTSGENQITFRNIAPGSYTFKVKARLKNHEWDENHVANVHLHISPPLWFTWYAKLFYLFIICTIIYAFLRSYKRKLEYKSSLEIERRNSQNEQELNEERMRFYTNITHELRTPLTLILGPLEDLTRDKNLPAIYNDIIQTIHSSALSLLNLINQLLEFRKTETQNRQLIVKQGDIADLATEIGLRYKELNRNPDLKFNIHIATNRTKLYFDADIITTILNNLLSNAVKYTPKGEITITLDSLNNGNEKYTVIKVSDTGYGIDAEMLPQIFNRYYQVKGKHQASGSGIGLALAKSLAILHEGILEVESRVGEGTTFTLQLLTNNTYPHALHGKEEPIAAFERIEDLTDDTELANTRPVLLIVEDNNDIRKYINNAFSDTFKVIEATNGKEGVEKAFDLIPDIIVSDIMMPEMDGIEFCRIIKEDIRTSHIPVILLTAKDSLRDKEEGYESGADSYLTKPFSANLLRSRIHNLLDSRAKLAKQINQRMHEWNAGTESVPEKFTGISELDNQFLEKITKIVEDNLDMEKLDVPFLTEQMNMSNSSFYRKVKGLTGIPPNEFIRKIRLRNSLRLLQSGDYNISETAYITGFNSLRYFRECFKDEYGMTPSEYIKRR